MGRPKKGAAVTALLSAYLEEYDLDDMNATNDMAALKQMCELEVWIDKLHGAMSKVKDPEKEAKTVKDLTTSIKDASATWSKLQTELGIAKKKRDSESDETPLSYIETLKKQAAKFIDRRFVKLICEDCNLPLGKYHIYITEHGEIGAMAYQNKKPDPIRFTFRVECPKCKKIITEGNEQIIMA